MTAPTLYLGNTPFQTSDGTVTAEETVRDGERFLRIRHLERMAPFFLTLVSDSDHWMFLSSKGGLTAGRKSPEYALFPYTTDDKIHDSSWNTGSRTVVRVTKGDRRWLWEPFSDSYRGVYAIERSLAKNVPGNQLVFEERNDDLQLAFEYVWCTSRTYGFVRKSRIHYFGDGEGVRIEVLDGVLNLLPAGVSRAMQTQYSTLVDAYKKNELVSPGAIGVFSLSSIPTDKAEPNESLEATVAWFLGPFAPTVLLCANQLDRFRSGGDVQQEDAVHGTQGAYLVHGAFDLAAHARIGWTIVLDGRKTIVDLLWLRDELRKTTLADLLDKDIARGTRNLIAMVARADGLQQTQDTRSTLRHFSNALFNILRGGIFEDHYRIRTEDFLSFLQRRNADQLARHGDLVRSWPTNLPYQEALRRSREVRDPDFERICHEYLPLTFSRRHGDPSRPWNQFAIDVERSDGTRVLNYQGNWRDIFQNWEALAFSYPGFIESMIARFVNASTPDGYNPYRIVREGFDWEVPDPHDPWSNIGYWGDHQLIYLLKLLEISYATHPQRLMELLAAPIFSYADVPYRIRTYRELCANPQESIVFDEERHLRVLGRVAALGTDGQLLPAKGCGIHLVSLTEKILLSVLTKLSNFVIGAGIWMNTQRPEWNDANNALVGNGASMVTLYYLRRTIVFLARLVAEAPQQRFALSPEVHALYRDILAALTVHRGILDGTPSATQRKTLLDALGQAGEAYRETVYRDGLTPARSEDAIETTQLSAFCDTVLAYIDHSIRANRREDGLYHAYNLLAFGPETIDVYPLYEMLEGQVAVLASGYADPDEALRILQALRNGPLYRADQNSLMLYPERKLARFVDKNEIPLSLLEQTPWLQRLADAGGAGIVVRDGYGGCHFDGTMRNAKILEQALRQWKHPTHPAPTEKDIRAACGLYEAVFQHRFFTGRSGTFYKYEGLGSIYWHMVAKLLPAIQEVFDFHPATRIQPICATLRNTYYAVREGLGVHKSPAEYGAFPTDPYSHTPRHLGAQQPGMTGQVKEDFLSRMRELGVCLHGGCIHLRTDWLQRSEFLAKPSEFRYIDIAGSPLTIALEADSLAFTYCQVPIVYRLGKEPQLRCLRADGSVVDAAPVERNHFVLDAATSAALWERTGQIERIDVDLAHVDVPTICD